MADPEKSAFDDLPRTARSHFLLHLYAAVFQLLRHLHGLAGADLGKTLERHPFLAGYLEETREQLPGELSWEAAPAWWRRQVGAWEDGCEGHLPLRALGRETGLDWAHRVALVLVGLVEEDSRFGTVFAELQAHLGERRPTLELVGQVMRSPEAPGAGDPWSLCRPLLDGALARAAQPAAPRSEWVLHVPPAVWDAVRGEPGAAAGFRYLPPASSPAVADLVVEPELHERLARLPELVAAGTVRAIVLRSHPGAEPLAVLGAVARARGRGLLVADLAAAGEQAWELAGPLATLSAALPVIVCDLGPGETRSLPALAGYGGAVGVSLGPEGGLRGPLTDGAVHLELPFPGAALRRRLWRRALGDAAGRVIDEAAERFLLDAGYVRQAAAGAAAHAALAGRRAVTLADVRQAARALRREQLDTLATRLEAEGTWELLVAGGGTRGRLVELERRCRHRERLLACLGPAFGAGANRGVRALLTGPSGTGKTLAARLLAAELGMDLYRVDLAAVVNKYIGETEKNLHQVLSRAEALDVVLLLDEGDALLGSRTEVRSANDRYANLETNYLLQRLETFQGIVLVTTNLAANVDSAFQRRMDVVVPFFPPQAEERLRIFELHLPRAHRVDAGYLERVAVRCALTGGQIRNAALHAALAALDDGGGAVERRHLEAALQGEYRKSGGTFPLGGNGAGRAADAGLGTFAAALAGSTAHA